MQWMGYLLHNCMEIAMVVLERAAATANRMPAERHALALKGFFGIMQRWESTTRRRAAC